MIKNFIFDIGNVLVDFDPIPFFEQRMPNMRMREIIAYVFDDDWEKMDEGLYSCEEVRQLKLKNYPQYGIQIQYIFDHWMEMMSEKADSTAYMKELKKKGYHTYILSNIGEESHAYLKEKYDFFDCVDGMILSYEHQLIKPDTRIYQQLLDTFQLEKEQSIFFDDKEENIESAQAMGIHGIVFKNIAQAKEEVEQYVSNK